MFTRVKMDKLTRFCSFSAISLVLLTSVFAQDPEITENILPDVRLQGMTGFLRCVVINQMDNQVYWIQKSTQNVITEDEKVIIDPKHNTIVNGYPKYMVERIIDGEKNIYNIIINRLEPYDAGWYTCQIVVRGTDQYPSRDGEMVVLYPPAVIQSRTTNAVSVKENDPVNMTCDATGYPTPNITWVRVNAAVLPNGELRYQSRFLYLDRVSKDDRGLYRCLADNNVRPPSFFDVKLYVYYSPIARAVQKSYGQAENRMFDVTIECTLAGWPEPELQWYKVLSGGNWDPISNTDKHTVNILLNHANILGPQERWFQLVVRAVQANDFGEYKCAGKNDQGQGNASVWLFATSECQGPNCPPEHEPEGGAHACAAINLMLVSVATILATYLCQNLS